jgi:hypothetical protein
MAPPLACIMCALTVDNTALIVPVAQATVIAVPFFFRTRIVAGVRRAVGRPATNAPASSDDEDCDTRPDDDHDRPQSPGALRP